VPPQDFRDLTCGLLETATCVFGEDVFYLPKSSNSKFPIRGIFDEVFEQVDADTETVIASTQPILGVKLADLPKNKVFKGDCFLIRKIRYVVKDSQEDGQGGSSIFLHKVGGQ